MTVEPDQIVEMGDRLAEYILAPVEAGDMEHGDALRVVTVAARLIQSTYPNPKPGELFSIIQEAEAALDLFASTIREA